MIRHCEEPLLFVIARSFYSFIIVEVGFPLFYHCGILFSIIASSPYPPVIASLPKAGVAISYSVARIDFN